MALGNKLIVLPSVSISVHSWWLCYTLDFLSVVRSLGAVRISEISSMVKSIECMSFICCIKVVCISESLWFHCNITFWGIYKHKKSSSTDTYIRVLSAVVYTSQGGYIQKKFT